MGPRLPAGCPPPHPTTCVRATGNFSFATKALLLQFRCVFGALACEVGLMSAFGTLACEVVNHMIYNL